MIVVLCWPVINEDISNTFRISLGGCVKSKANLAMIILQISIYSFRSSNHTTFRPILFEILSKQTSISVRIISSDDYQAIKIQVVTVLQWTFKLFRLLDLISARSDHIEPTHISELVHVLSLNFNEVSFDYSSRPFKKSIKFRVRMKWLYGVKDTWDHIVTSRGLPPTEHTSYSKWRRSFNVTTIFRVSGDLDHFHKRFPI